MNVTRRRSADRPRVVNRHFLRHYAEMVAVMFAGMGVLYVPTELALGAFGSGWSELGDAAMLGAMGATMTVPMVAWMRLRMGHGRRPSLEMAAAMVLPTLASIGLLAAGATDDAGGVMMLEHVAMLAAMFGVMALRPEEYSGHGHHHQAALA
jgi:hypothetical protein